MTHNTADGADEERVPSLVEQLLARGDIAGAIAASARAGAEATRKGIPTDPTIMDDAAHVAQATGNTRLQRISMIAAHRLRHPDSAHA